MSLIAETKKLRELEQRIPNLSLDGTSLLYPDGDEACRCRSDIGYSGEDGWLAGTDLAEFVLMNRNLAPAMLEVLGCFKEGDEDLLVEYIYQFTEEYGVDGVVFSDTAFGKFMKRMQKAASIMEQEEREG